MIASEVHDVRVWLIQLDTAATPSPAKPADGDYRVAHPTYVFEASLPLGELLIDVVHPLLDPGVTSVRLAGYG